MADAPVLEFPPAVAARATERIMENAREAHITAFLTWLEQAHPSRDDAELEIEVFAATARQLVAVNTRPPRT